MKNIIMAVIMFLGLATQSFSQVHHNSSFWGIVSSESPGVTLVPWHLTFFDGAVMEGRYNFDHTQSLSLFTGPSFQSEDESVFFAPLIGGTVGKTFSVGVVSHLVVSKDHFLMYTLNQGIINYDGFNGYHWGKYVWKNSSGSIQLGASEQFFPSNKDGAWSFGWEVGLSAQVTFKEKFYVSSLAHAGIVNMTGVRVNLGVGIKY